MEKSTDFNAQEAASMIEEMVDEQQIREFISGDERKTVTAAAEARMEELKAAGDQKPLAKEAEEKPRYYTINIPEIEGDVKNVTVRGYGTDKKGRNISCECIIPRGIDVPNVPEMAVNVLKESVERRFTAVEKADKTGNVLQERKVQGYPFSIVEGPYTEMKPEPKKK